MSGIRAIEITLLVLGLTCAPIGNVVFAADSPVRVSALSVEHKAVRR